MDRNIVRNTVIELASNYLCLDEKTFLSYLSKYDIVSSIVSWAYRISLMEGDFSPIEDLNIEQKRELFNFAKTLRTDYNKNRIIKVCESLYFRQIAYKK